LSTMVQPPGRYPARKDGDESVYDATGSQDNETCPRCGSDATITYHYTEGFQELECTACGYMSDAEEIMALQRYESGLLESSDRSDTLPPFTGRKIKA